MGSSDQPSPIIEMQKLLQMIERSLQRYQLTGDFAALDDAILAWERILSFLDLLEAEPSLMAAAKNDAGSSYL